MAWTYSDWAQQGTRAAQISRLQLHMQEVADKIDVNLSAGGSSKSSSHLQTYYDRLERQIDRLRARRGRFATGRVIGLGYR